MSKNVDPSRMQTEFALAALMEIPSQYKATLEHGLLGRQRGNAPDRVPLPPPLNCAASFGSSSKPHLSGSFQKTATPYAPYDAPVSTAPSSSSHYDNQVCPICLTNAKNMAFGCGHQTCCDCGEDLQSCPICRNQIQTRIKLY